MSSRGQRVALGLVMILLAAGLAGCADPLNEPQKAARPVGAFNTTFRILNITDNKPVFLARVTILNDSTPLVAIATDTNGTAPVEVPDGATAFEVLAAGYAPHRARITRAAAVILVRLRPALDAEGLGNASGLHFRPAIDLGSKKYIVAVGTSCLADDAGGDRDADCGLGEPSVEVDGRGTVYVSGVCCIGNAPPVYVSRDQGATFKPMETPAGLRERFGIEGDFAVDGQGTVYFADIELAATFQVTAWDKDGTFIRHTKWPAPPLVDRDWIRAEGTGKLYYVYNTGGGTNVYTSSDGGMTWSPRPAVTLPYGLGNAVGGVKPGELWVLGGQLEGKRRADYTLDGGATWKSERTSALLGGSFPTGEFDEGGNLYVTSAQQDRIHVSHRAPDGTWGEPVLISPDVGHHRMPWLSAGAAGKAAVAWYGTLADSDPAKWYLFVAVSFDADSLIPHWQVAIADPEPVLVGDLGRQLLDFLQSEVGPDGAVHVAYSKLRPTEPNGEEQLHYVRSDPITALAPLAYFSGPRM